MFGRGVACCATTVAMSRPAYGADQEQRANDQILVTASLSHGSVRCLPSMVDFMAE